MDEVFAFLQGFNIQTIISLFLVCWYFVRDIKKEIRALEDKMDSQTAAQSARSDRLYEMFQAQTASQYEMFEAQISKQAARSDQLYEMFIALLKEKRK